MIGESDHYRADIVARDLAELNDPDCPFVLSDDPREPAIGSSSIPFEGDVNHLLESIDQINYRYADETWDGTQVAENAKSDGEAEIHDTNGRLRLVVATETTKDDCVALLMRPHEFRAIFGYMQAYRRHSLNYYKISHELNEASCQSQDLWREIYDCEEELPKLQASDSAAAGTWRCQERLSELRVPYEDVKRRESALEKSQKKEISSMDSLGGSVTSVIEDAFEEANLLPHLPTPPHSCTDSQPSPSVEGGLSVTCMKSYRIH
jgi:hypothetical protein